jgi:hypothetical protein
MKPTKVLMASILLCALCACGEQIFIPPITPAAAPSNTPVILSPTPIILMASATTSATPLLVPPSSSPTFTLVPSLEPSLTPTPTITNTPLPAIGLDILGCNTSLDISHQMGEVTNAFPVIRNTGVQDLTNVCATLSASDEARVHPDKTKCVPSLPAGTQVTLKLTVDTGFGNDTAIKVDVTSLEAISASVTRASCSAIGLPNGVSTDVGRVEPIH